jgi:hypothetical protein
LHKGRAFGWFLPGDGFLAVSGKGHGFALSSSVFLTFFQSEMMKEGIDLLNIVMII